MRDHRSRTKRRRWKYCDRSERIRTYNYHQGRVTDHRIGLTLYKLDSILAGDLDEIVDALTLAQAAENAGGSEE